MSRPTLHVTNWSSRKLHGDGRQITIMAKPRHWERGDGSVPSCTPHPEWLDEVKRGVMPLETYRAEIMCRLSEYPTGPGGLIAIADCQPYLVADGDTLCCACSRAAAEDGRCHRSWVAAFLARSGWRVILDGTEVPRG